MASESRLIVLVRSGRTDWDDQGRIQGQADLPLSRSGAESLPALIGDVRQALGGARPSVLFAGPDEASLATAGAIADALKIRSKPLADLVSMNLGLWQGLLESEIEGRYPSVCRMWRDAPALIHPPKGEAFVDAEWRVRLALARLFERPAEECVLAVCRPLPFAMAACWLQGRSPNAIWEIVEDGPGVIRIWLDRDQVRSFVEEVKAGA